MLSYVVLNRYPDPVVYPCWMLAVLVLVVVGFVLPSFLLFVAEVVARRAFLLTKTSQNYRRRIFEYSAAAMRVAILAFAASSVGTWFFLSSVRDLLY